ncbi:ketoacyl-ACP synthase III [Phytoactinopolyspora alkaliphila]|uniref:Ketoacyl-ACP synthase III n=1 Tax=Phytoactinopolyspora alkaliphila TaxID=1783498 RepID=A0A6N9YK19_9ACTN|nr:ketoacyl-ACP synthase III [Phytoactinopolyspora alkaliphila]
MKSAHEGLALPVRVAGLGHYQPTRVVTNDDLAEFVDTNDEWIRKRVGIVARRFAGDESVVDMAVAAARDALRHSGISRDGVGLVVVATCSNLDRSPSTAGRVIEAMELDGAAGFDVNAACSGFVHAFALAAQAITTGRARTAVVIGSERMSDVTDWADRSTSVLVGDGAGAVVLTASDAGGVSPVIWGTVPGLADAVRIERPASTFAQDGRKVFRWAVTEAAQYAREAIAAAGLKAEDIAVFIPHQANLRIIEPLAEQLGLTGAVVATDVRESGNTSAASIPLAWSKLHAAGALPSGGATLLFGFGGGFSYAGTVVLTP